MGCGRGRARAQAADEEARPARRLGLADAAPPQGAIALVGFGDYHKESTFYEPHWTCVERVTPRMLFLRDSDEYTRIPRAETGVRPEDGWEIEDCYILER